MIEKNSIFFAFWETCSVGEGEHCQWAMAVTLLAIHGSAGVAAVHPPSYPLVVRDIGLKFAEVKRK
jgi:hypothetical protein